jgi:hypothetical protein
VYYGETDAGRLLAVIVAERRDRLRVVTAYDLNAGQKREEMPKFKSQSEEADWWAGAAGRNYVKRKSKAALAKGINPSGSSLVTRLNAQKSHQIAIRLPEADIEQARKLAGRKGIGYQTLLKMIVHQGLQREERRG